MKPHLAFVAYPVKDISAARRFYDAVLAVEPRAISDDWLEYDTGEGVFVITQADAEHPVPVRGALVAFEVADIEAEVTRLREHAIAFRGEIVETAICRFAVVSDPDGSECLIHQRKAHPNATPTI